jgi:hypothetical protein
MDMLMDCPLLVNKKWSLGFEFLTAVWVMTTAFLTDNVLQMFCDTKLLSKISKKLQINTASYTKNIKGQIKVILQQT